MVITPTQFPAESAQPKVRRVPFAALALGCVAAAVVSSAAADKTPKQTPKNGAKKEDAGLALVKNYRKWTRVNPKPLNLPAPLDALCAAPTQQQQTQTSANPHRRKFFTVYVNGVGRGAMMQQAHPQFPPGSIIVKEKSVAADSAAPEMMTVMLKHKKGWNPANGDWEYMVVNGAQTKVEGRGAIARCQTCHAQQKDNDFVFRTYLTDEVERELK